MEQLNLFGETTSLPYKYIIDACSIISQKNSEPNRRDVFKSLWKYIDELVRDNIIVTCSEVADEIHNDAPLLQWITELRCAVLAVDDDIQKNVIDVVTKHPNLIDFKQIKSSGDAFLIATAMKYGLIIITEEDKKSYKKIPQVASSFGVESVSIIELCAKEGKEF